MRHFLLHMNHCSTCKSNKLLTPQEVVSGVLDNLFRLLKRQPLSTIVFTIVFTKHNLVRRITRRTCSLIPHPYNSRQNLDPISALFQGEGFSNGTPYLLASIFGFAITLVSTQETNS